MIFVQFECPHCKVKIGLETDLPNLENANKSLGVGITKKELSFDCPYCSTSVEISLENGTAGPRGHIVGHPASTVTAIETIPTMTKEQSEWLSLAAPSNPYKVFTDSSFRLNDILIEIGEGRTEILFGSAELVRRMTFGAVISSMEAYLGDRLANVVFSDERILRKLLSSESELQKISVKLIQILDNPGIVASATREYLATILYHNLPKVGVLYKIALGIDFFPDEALKVRLLKAVALRHDIVHRNGKTVDGEITEFPSDLVYDVIKDVRVLVEHVEQRSKEALINLKADRKTLMS